MTLKKVVSKSKKHSIKFKDKKTGKDVEKQVPNSILLLVLDSGCEVAITPLKKEDTRLLESHARVEYK